MIKNLSRKLAVGAAALVLAAGAAVPRASAQFPGTGSLGVILDVAPGTRQCITNPTMAYRNASVEDFVLYGAPVKFIFASSRLGEVSNSGYPVWSYSDYVSARPSFPPSFFPFDFFPGYFRTCARNDSTEYSTVYLSVTVDQ